MNTDQQLRELLTKLKLPARFTFSDLVRSVQVYSTKKISFLPWSLPPHVTGACLQSDSSIYIFYPEGAMPAYQTVIKLHELTHVVLGHSHTQLNRQEEEYITNAILGVNLSYKDGAQGLVLRSLTNSNPESEVENLARELLHRLLPERSPDEQSLSKLNMD